MARRPFDRAEPLRVQAEAIGGASAPWAWAIYRGAGHFLIARSQAKYGERADALQAGLKAAELVGRRLRVEVVVEDSSGTQRTAL